MRSGLQTAAHVFLDGAALFFFVYFAGYTLLLLLEAAFGEDVWQRENARAAPRESRRPPVSAIVPSHDSGEALLETVAALLALQYPDLEIVVVDDGSADDAARRLRERYRLRPAKMPPSGPLHTGPVSGAFSRNIGTVRLMLLQKPGGGRADALNAGINAARSPFFLRVDPGDVPAPDALGEIVVPAILDPETAAVGGAVTVKNTGRFWGAVQVGEYERSFLSARPFFDRIGWAQLLSGSFALFRREAVVLAGGYRGGELEMVLRLRTALHRARARCVFRYAPAALCRIPVPDSLPALCAACGAQYLAAARTLWRHRGIALGAAGLWPVFPWFYCVLYGVFAPQVQALGFAAVFLAFCFLGMPGAFVPFLLGSGACLAAATAVAYAENAAVRGRRASLRSLAKCTSLALVEAFALRPVLWAVRFTALPRAMLRKRRKK